MNWDQRERQWNEWSGTAMLHWEKIMNDDIATVASLYEGLNGRSQVKYGIVKEGVNRQGNDFKKIDKQLKKSNNTVKSVQTSLRKKR